MRVYLHCGFHKTGTTSFQHYLRENRAHWPEGFVALTKMDAPVRAVRQRMTWYCEAPNGLTRYLLRRSTENLARFVGGLRADTVLLTMEGYSGRVPDEIERSSVYPHANHAMRCLEKAFANHEVTFLFTTREKLAWIKSVHAHRVRVRGLSADLDEFSAREKYQSLDWGKLVAEVTSGMRSNVAVRAMEDDLAEYGWPGVAFLELAGVGAEDRRDWQDVPRRNIGLDPETLEAARRSWWRFLPGPVRRRIFARITEKS